MCGVLAIACVGGLLPPRDPAALHAIPAFAVPDTRPGVTYQRFAVLGDHGNGSAGQRRVAGAMAQRAAREPIEFMLTVGDNFYDSGVASVDDPLWETRWEQVYAAPALQVPVHPTLGNHDRRGNAEAQVEYSKRSERWRMPSRYYTFRKPLDGDQYAQFFALDTRHFGPRDPEQTRWLERELASSEASWKIVYGHHPVFSFSDRGPNPRMLRNLEPLLREHRVDLYLAGHHHVLELLEPVGGVTHAVCGAAGGPRERHPIDWTDMTRYAATGGGYCLLRLSAHELVIEFVRMKGETQFAHVLYRRGERRSD